MRNILENILGVLIILVNFLFYSVGLVYIALVVYLGTPK